MSRLLTLTVLLLAAAPLAAKSAGEILKENRSAIVNLRLVGWLQDDVGNWGEGEWTCTGFVIDSSGVIATNGHCMDGATSGRAIFEDGSQLPVQGIRAFEYGDSLLMPGEAWWDVAVVQVPGFGLDTVTLGDSADVEVGGDVVIIGFPLQFTFEEFGEEVPTPNLTKGIISSVRVLDGVRQIGTDAAISGGNSGGPAFDSDGRVIGLATWHVVGGQNLNFIFPVNYLRGLDTSTVLWDIDTWMPDPRGGPSPGPVVDPPMDSDSAEGLFIHDSLSFWFFPPSDFGRESDDAASTVYRSAGGDWLYLDVLSAEQWGDPADPFGSSRDAVGLARGYQWTGQYEVNLDGYQGMLYDYSREGGYSGTLAVFADGANSVLIDLEPAGRLQEVFDGMILFLEEGEDPGLDPSSYPDVPVRDLEIWPPLDFWWWDDLWYVDESLAAEGWTNLYPDQVGEAGAYEKGPYLEIYEGGMVAGVAGELQMSYDDDMALVATVFFNGASWHCADAFEALAQDMRIMYGDPTDEARLMPDGWSDPCAALEAGVEGVLYRAWYSGPGDWWTNQEIEPTGDFVSHNGVLVTVGIRDGRAVAYAIWEHDSVLPAWGGGSGATGDGPLAFGLWWGADLFEADAIITGAGLENEFPMLLGQPSTDESGFDGFPYMEWYAGAEISGVEWAWETEARFYYDDGAGLARMVFTLAEDADCGEAFADLFGFYLDAYGAPPSTPPYDAGWECGAGSWGDGAFATWTDAYGSITLSAGWGVEVAFDPPA